MLGYHIGKKVSEKKKKEKEKRDQQRKNPKRVYKRKVEKNLTYTWKYKDIKKKCPFAFTIQLVKEDKEYKYPWLQNKKRWILKACNPLLKDNCRPHCHHYHMRTEHMNAPTVCMPAKEI